MKTLFFAIPTFIHFLTNSQASAELPAIGKLIMAMQLMDILNESEDAMKNINKKLARIVDKLEELKNAYRLVLIRESNFKTTTDRITDAFNDLQEDIGNKITDALD